VKKAKNLEATMSQSGISGMAQTAGRLQADTVIYDSIEENKNRIKL